MILKTPEAHQGPFDKDIKRIKSILRSFTQDIENLHERVQTGDGVSETEVRKLFGDLRSWLKWAYETEKSLERERTDTSNFGIDFDAARDQIGCRLDRLRRCCVEK